VVLLHLGGNRSVRLAEIEALFDSSLFVRSPVNREFIDLARSEGRLAARTEQPARTVVITGGPILLSPLSRATLTRRATARFGLDAGPVSKGAARPQLEAKPQLNLGIDRPECLEPDSGTVV